MSTWFQRIRKGINTETSEKRDAPDGMWYLCPKCKKTYTSKEHQENLYVCLTEDCDQHERIASADYFNIFFDKGKYETHFDNLRSKDILKFEDLKTYKDRLDAAYKKTNLNDAIQVANGTVDKIPITIAAMDFKFIGGSMGSVVGEKISLAVDLAIKNKSALMIISKSGGARMMESVFSLMQMAKTSAKLTQLAEAKLPYISFLTDPTTGGVTASFAMLGDVNITEPGALIGFAGPRVIKETIKKDLPEGFQRSEFLLDHGMIDMIIQRKNLREEVSRLLRLFKA